MGGETHFIADYIKFIVHILNNMMSSVASTMFRNNIKHWKNIKKLMEIAMCRTCGKETEV